MGTADTDINTDTDTDTEIQFYYRGVVQRVPRATSSSAAAVSVASTRSTPLTVLQWLRQEALCMGTKEACAEGDCGACMVAVADVVDVAETSEAGVPRLKAVNSCIHFLSQLHGKALFTVEDLATASGLHPVQQAMLEGHASQCGFCTPGLVMTLWVDHETRCLQKQALPNEDEIRVLLDGNLCRCTGYLPIIKAAQQASTVRSGGFFRPDWGQIANTLSAITAHPPSTVAQACALKAEHPEALLLAGGTDIGLWHTKQLRVLPRFIDLRQIEACQSIKQSEDGETLEIGAAVSVQAAFTELRKTWPQLEDFFKRFASPPIRGTATLVGNVANGSPIGDSMPLLLVLDAQLRIASVRGERLQSLANFYLDYQLKDLAVDEIITHVLIPKIKGNVQAEKVSKRLGQDISALVFAARLQLDKQEISEVRLAFGGMAATPKRALQAEQVLQGQRLSKALIARAVDSLSLDFSPISDMRASAAYRMAMANSLCQRYLEGFLS
jgi:xanthine dehydrogenase small subunit